MKTYTRRDEARRRLLRSIVKLNGDPVYITDVFTTARDRRRGPFFGDQLGDLLYVNPEGFADLDGEWEEYMEEQDYRFSYVHSDDDWELRYQQARDNNEIFLRRWSQAGDDGGRGDAPNNPSGLSVSCFVVDDPHETAKQATIEELDLTPFKLGMVNNTGARAVHVQRLPNRRNYSQGITDGNVLITHLVNDIASHNCPPRIGRFSPELGAALRGNYPTLRSILADLPNQREEIVAQAFSRDMSVVINTKLGLCILYYKGRQVGYSEDGSVFKISPNYGFLEECLVKQGVTLHATSQ